MTIPLLAIVGPTATGKSDLGVALALRLGGEVINTDASQFYRGMDIGTAKLPVADRHGVPHHLLDHLPVTATATAAEYQQLARETIHRVQVTGKVPILVGGSGLYIRAALDVMEFPGTDAHVRASVEARLERIGVAALFAELTDRDPVAAAAMEPNNARRIVRALEVMDLTGRPFSATMPRREYVQPSCQIGLDADRPMLYERTDRRVAQMVADGLIDEVLGLLPQGLADGVTASRALGYAQVLAQLPGPVDADTVITETALATRRFAKRQQAWFRPDPRIHWLHNVTDISAVVDDAAAHYQQYCARLDGDAATPVD